MDADTINVAVAGGVTLVTSLLVLRSGYPRELAEAEHDPEAPAPIEPDHTEPPPRHRASTSTPHRPRILTGEPGIPEQRKPAPRRALRLVAGIAALAIAGAVGLLAFVRALISMFDRIGG